MAGSGVEETYEDVQSDEVRPSVRVGDGNSSTIPIEGEPDYRRLRDDATGSPTGGDMDNPNRYLEGDRDGQDAVASFRIDRDALSADPLLFETRDPPYERMMVSDVMSLTQGERAASERGSSSTGLGDHGGGGTSVFPPGVPRASMNPARGEGQVCGASKLEPRLNGWSGSRDQAEPQQAGQNQLDQLDQNTAPMNPAVERLLHQLLQQNALLQQELLEARANSGSGSNVSQEVRLEGRGVLRAVEEGSGVHRKGKGVGTMEGTSERVGTQTGRIITPPWTTLAVPPEAQAGFLQPSLSTPPPLPPSLRRPNSPGFGDVSRANPETSRLGSSVPHLKPPVSRQAIWDAYRSPTDLLPSEEESRLPQTAANWTARSEVTGHMVGGGVFPGICQGTMWNPGSEGVIPSIPSQPSLLSLDNNQIEGVNEQFQAMALKPMQSAKPPPSVSDLDRILRHFQHLHYQSSLHPPALDQQFS